jgi:hypothetical protein
MSFPHLAGVGMCFWILFDHFGFHRVERVRRRVDVVRLDGGETSAQLFWTPERNIKGRQRCRKEQI